MSTFAAVKDPDAVLDYKVDWSAWLAASETITTSTWTAPAGVTVTTSSHDTTSATAWLSGGATGGIYDVTNRIVTNQGRTDDRTIKVRVVNR